jgi:hypothetical protein
LDKARAGTEAAVQLGHNIFTGISSRGTIRTPEISTATAGGDIIFAPGNEVIWFGGRVNKFCSWVNYGIRKSKPVDRINKYCPSRWAAVAMSITKNNNGSGMRYKSIPAIEKGYMLCCRFGTFK